MARHEAVNAYTLKNDARAVVRDGPACGEPQPDPDNGSHMWLAQQLQTHAGRRTCVACGVAMQLVARRTARF